MGKARHPIQDPTGRRRGWTTVVIQVDEHKEFVPRLVELARERQWQLVNLYKFLGQPPASISPRGAIVETLPTDPMVQEMLKRGVAVVRLGRLPHPDDHLVPTVMPDWSATGRIAADHFFERDFKHLGFVGRNPWGDAKPIYDGFAARAAELGCKCHLLRFVKSGDAYQALPGEHPLAVRWRSHQQQLTRWLAELPKPVGILAICDRHADRYSFWATEAGFRVPEDLAVLGVGNQEFVCESASPPISSIALNYDRIAQVAADLLTQTMAGGKPDPTPVLVPPCGLVTRQSTDILAASDPLVVDALRFMWDHVNDNLSVDQVAQHVGVARRTLEKAFQRGLGRGINEEVQRRRLERARALILQTNLSMGQIASSLGYSNQSQLSRAFRSAYGLTPARYRRNQQPA